MFPGNGYPGRNVRPACERVGQLAQQVAQAAVGQDRWPQFGQQLAHLGQGPPRQPAQVFQRLPRLDRVAVPQARQDFGDQAGGEERLVDGIVKVLPRRWRSCSAASARACSYRSALTIVIATWLAIERARAAWRAVK